MICHGRTIRMKKMKLNAREKIRLKRFSSREILSLESTFLCQQPVIEKKKLHRAKEFGLWKTVLLFNLFALSLAAS